MKASLFDVCDPSSPVSVNSIIKTSSYILFEYDYRALSVLKNNGSYRFAFLLRVAEDIPMKLRAFWLPLIALFCLKLIPHLTIHS
jgi:hypothetical protein